MGGLYIALAHSHGDPTEVALSAATLKTVLQVATPSTTDIRVFAWGISFDGTSATGEPVKVGLVDTAFAATVTSLTPDKWESDLAPSSLCVGGVSATGVNASVEGTPSGTSRVMDAQEVHPQTGYSVWFLEGRHCRVPISRFLKIRCTAPAAVNCVPWIVWEEPA